MDTGAGGGAAGRLDRGAAERIARGLRAVADPTRVQILSLIVEADGGRRAVTELADELGLTQPTVSHHLRVMAEAGVLESTQDGRLVWYSITRARLADVFDAVHDDRIAATVARPVLELISDDLATRFAGTFSRQTVSEYVHESYRLLAEGAGITRYLPSLTSRFASDRLRSLADVGRPVTNSVPNVLFVCIQNAGRSQIASAILRSLAGERVRVLTAGSEPAASINPKIVAALDEIGISIAGEYPKPLTDEVVRGADYVITMGCGDACPVYPGRRYLDWDLPDPADMSVEGIREVRDDIGSRVRALLIDMTAVNSA